MRMRRIAFLAGLYLLLAAWGRAQASQTAVLPYHGDCIVADRDGSILYRYHDGDDPTQIRAKSAAYATALAPFGEGVLAAYSDGAVYFAWKPLEGVAGEGRGVQWRGAAGSYVTSLLPYKDGLLAAYSNGAVFWNPSVAGGLAGVAGEGGGKRIQPESSNPVVSLQEWNGGVIAVFADGAAYYNPDGRLSLSGRGRGAARLAPGGSQPEALTTLTSLGPQAGADVKIIKPSDTVPSGWIRTAIYGDARSAIAYRIERFENRPVHSEMTVLRKEQNPDGWDTVSEPDGPNTLGIDQKVIKRAR